MKNKRNLRDKGRTISCEKLENRILLSTTLAVAATSDFWLLTDPSLSDGGGGTAAPSVTLPNGPNRTVTFTSVAGIVHDTSAISSGPDGVSGTNGGPSSVGGFSGITTSNGGFFALIGVFVANTIPTSNPPPSLDYGLTQNNSSFSPLLNQVFFVGDGLTGTGTGTIQQFNVPNAATKLYLGFGDTPANQVGPPGGYSDDSGQVSATVNVTVPPPQLTFATTPPNATAGKSIGTIIVDVDQPPGQVLSTDNSFVTLQAIVGPGTLAGTVTVQAVHGVATFSNLVIYTAGDYRFYASDGSDNPTVSAEFTVSPAAASQLVFASEPTNANAGAKLNPVVAYEMDPYGNIVRTDNSVVQLSVHSGPGTISGTAAVALNNGAAIFSNIRFDTPGTYSLIAQDGALAPIVSSPFQIAVAYQLVFASGPTNTPMGTVLNPPVVVYLMDYDGNIIRNNSSVVTLSIASGPGAIAGTTSAVLNSGAAVFNNISFATAGTYTITASGSTFAPITSSAFLATTASILVFAAGPTNNTADSIFNPPIVVYVEDQFGNIVRNINSIITLAVLSGPGTLSGTTSIALNNGAAVFNNVKLATSGSYTLIASDGMLATATSGTFMIS